MENMDKMENFQLGYDFELDKNIPIYVEKNLFNDIGDCFAVFSIAETKLDNSFSNAQFFTPGYKSPYRLDVSYTSGGIMVYVKKGLPSLLLTSFSIPNDVQIIPIEIRLKNMKWLIISISRPPKQDLVYFLSNLSNLIDFYNFEKCLIIGDFNVEPSDTLQRTAFFWR